MVGHVVISCVFRWDLFHCIANKGFALFMNNIFYEHATSNQYPFIHVLGGQ